MWVAASLVAREVEDAHQLTLGRQNWRGRAGEEAVALQIVLAAVDFHLVRLGQRGTDGVGAALVFGPAGAAHERHAFSLVQKLQVTQGVHQHALRIRKDDHALAFPHLLEQVLHDGLGVTEQVVVVLTQALQGGASQVVGAIQTANGRQACVQAALPGPRDHIVQAMAMGVALLDQLQAGLA